MECAASNLGRVSLEANRGNPALDHLMTGVGAGVQVLGGTEGPEGPELLIRYPSFSPKPPGALVRPVRDPCGGLWLLVARDAP